MTKINKVATYTLSRIWASHPIEVAKDFKLDFITISDKYSLAKDLFKVLKNIQRNMMMLSSRYNNKLT